MPKETVDKKTAFQIETIGSASSAVSLSLGTSALRGSWTLLDRARHAGNGHPFRQFQLFDHFVGAGEQGWWHRQAKCFSGLEIDR